MTIFETLKKGTQMNGVLNRYYAEKRRGVNDLGSPSSELGRGLGSAIVCRRALLCTNGHSGQVNVLVPSVSGMDNPLPGRMLLSDSQSYQGEHGKKNSDQIKCVQRKSHVVLLCQRVPC
jgi:hypothetical protein